MGSFSPEMLPVLSTLAKNFAVYDAWHCAVPSQTFCNRSFFHASTSHGFVTNKHGGGYQKWLDANRRADDLQPARRGRISMAHLLRRAAARLLHRRAARTGARAVLAHRPLRDHVPVLRRRAHGQAPRVLLHRAPHDLQPQRLPPAVRHAPRDRRRRLGRHRQRDLRRARGRGAVHEIYYAIKASATDGGSNALNTMLLITFDEHGGTYDHVAPPSATPPHPDAEPGEMGFTFDRLGCRVPAIAISAYTRGGTVINDEHAPRIRDRDAQPPARPEAAHAARRRGERDVQRRQPRCAEASDHVALDAFRSTSRRTRRARRRTPAHAHKDKPLSPPARGLLGLLLAKYGTPDDGEPATYADAYELLHKYGIGLFGAPR